MSSPSPAPDHPPSPASTSTDGELVAERAHLAEARATLARMRSSVLSLDAKAGAMEIGEDPGKHAFQRLEVALEERAKALADSPDTPLFFGRLDYAPSGRAEETGLRMDVAGETFRIGRRHVAGEHGQHPQVIDWRAPVSVPFYRAIPTDPMGVLRRRRYAFSGGELTGYEDEQVAGAAPRQGLTSQLVADEIERPRVGPMRDIVATIQPEQDEIVRTDLSATVCVQGAPGTGKTAVGLHRAAYLLYTHREQLKRQRLLVIGPNAAFLRYIADVLPALGEIDASQATIEQLLAAVRVRGTEPAEVATLKGDVRMAQVLERALWARVDTEPGEPLVVRRGSRRFRVPGYEVGEMVAQLRGRGVRYESGRGMLPQRLAHAVLLRMEAGGDSPDDRVQNAVARSREVKDYVAAMWPKIKPTQVLWELFADPAVLGAAADGLLTEAEQALLRWSTPPRSAGTARWTPADAALVDELTDLIERIPSLGHVVLDEAQDLSSMQLRAVGRRCSTGSATILGDIAQGTTPWAARSWEQALADLGKSTAHLEELTLGFRVPGTVLDYAARLLPVIAPGLERPTSVRRDAGDLSRHEVAGSAVVTEAVRQTGRLAETLPGSVGVVVPDALVRRTSTVLTEAGVPFATTGDEDDATARVELVPATLAKGLEFDSVVLVEPAAIVAAEADRRTGLRRLYVCLTRAVTSLVLVHAAAMPDELGLPAA